MCGIVGYVGPDQALPIVLEGLRRLEYRGYDSAGVAVLADDADRLTVVRRAGKLGELEAALADAEPLDGHTAMGHTRWATHGAPTDRNAHPHQDCHGRIAVIHNGIIENFQSLRARLEKDGHVLSSETDTECVAHLIEEHVRDGAGLADAVRGTVRELQGAYALVVVSSDEPGLIVGVRVSSPLIVGLGDGETLLASDIPAVLDRTTTVIPVEEGQVVEARREGVAFTDFDGNAQHPEPIVVEHDVARAQKGGFEDFMLKEIHEQPGAIRDTLVGRVVGGRLVMDELRIADDVLREVDKVFVVACGTAFHSGLVAKYAIEHWTRLPVEIEIASEFRYRDPVLGADTLTLAVSQSGETIDTLEAARHARRQGSHLIAVTNTVGSSLAREADGVLYTHAGPEIAVAGTKTFATQMVSQYLVALYLAQVRGSMFPAEIAEILERMDELPAPGPARDRTGRRGPSAGRAVPGRAGRLVHREAHRLSGRARGRAQAQGAQLRPRGGVPGRRAEARPDRAHRGRHAGRGDRHRMPRVPEDALQHPGGARPRRGGDRDRRRKATSRSARWPTTSWRCPPRRSCSRPSSSPFRCSCSRTTWRSSAVVTSTNRGTWPRA